MTTEQKISFTPDFTSSAKVIATELANEHSAKEGSLFAREAYIKQKTESLCEQFLENFYQRPFQPRSAAHEIKKNSMTTLSGW